MCVCIQVIFEIGKKQFFFVVVEKIPKITCQNKIFDRKNLKLKKIKPYINKNESQMWLMHCGVQKW